MTHVSGQVAFKSQLATIISFFPEDPDNKINNFPELDFLFLEENSITVPYFLSINEVHAD